MDKLLDKAKTSSIRRWPVGLLAAALVVSVSAAPNSTKTGDKKSPSASTAPVSPVAKLKSTLADMPLAFEANQGQTDASVKFLTRTQNFTVFLTPQETVMRGRNADVLRMQLRNANQSPNVVGEDKQLKITNYFVGDKSTWHANVPNYGEVRYQDVYSGIDMVYHSDQRQLEYDFVVKPEADPNQIRVAFEGASNIRITEKGDLELTSIAGKSVNHKPLVYQTIAGKRNLVDGEFVLASNTVGFKLGQYDRTQPLVIDPTLQVLSFFGGTLNDEAAAIATTSAVTTGVGIVFVGRAESPALPTAGGALSATKTTVGLSWDAFATGLNGGVAGGIAGAGTIIAWTTYFGGSGDDAARAVAMDNQGNTYVTGYTDSANFLGTLTSSNYDAFLVKLGTGGAISASTLYGGPSIDQGTSIALDYSTFSGLATAGSIANPATDPRVVPNVVIGGLTNGSIGQPGSPTSTTKIPDGYQPTFNYPQTGAPGTTDGFIAIFSSTLTLLHATYLGGGGNDQVNGVAADVWGNIYATGYATPAVAALIPPATIPTFFPVVNGITGGTNLTTPPGTTPPPFTNVDASRAPQGAATAFLVKFGCTTGTPPNGPIGVGTSPPFGLGSGYTSPFALCGGLNNLKTLSNSALWGGSAGGNLNPTFINPDQVANGGPGITEAGLGIAVDQNGWGQEGVSGTFTSFNGWGFADIVPNGGSASALGFQPGLSGPHVYIVGATASSDFAKGLANPVCTNTDSAGVPMCPTPEIWGSVVQTVGGLPVPACDPGLGGFCPITVPNVNLRVTTVANGSSNSGQTQGWLVSFQLPAITTEIVTPPAVTTNGVVNAAPTTSVNTLNPPTIPNYIVLQPLTCPQQAPSATEICLNGSNNSFNTTSAALDGVGFTNASPAPPSNFGCVGGTPTGVSCPAAFIGSWNAVTVDSDQQVYVVGQVGFPNAAILPGNAGTHATFNAGSPTRLALEIERISPYAQTNGTGLGVSSNTCGGFASPPCAFPEPVFTGGTSSFIVDALNGGGVYGASLPASPPKPDPNQPGGVGNGIAVNIFREAFFVGTTSAVNGMNGVTATATATVVTGGQIQITITKAGSGYTSVPTVTVTPAAGCTVQPGNATGGFTATLGTGATAGMVVAITPPLSGSNCITPAPTVTISAAPGAGFPIMASPITMPTATSNPPIPAFQGNLGTTGGSNNIGTSNGGPEDVLFGAIQFYDAISSYPPNTNVVNFTATVNSIPSITGPNSTLSDPSTMGVGARGVITYYDESGQVLNIPPGCQVTAAPIAGQNGTPAFTVTQIGNTATFQVSVTPGAVNFPGVVSDLIAFTKTPSGICTGFTNPQINLDSWDPIMATLTVSAPLNVSSEDTFGTISNPLTTGLLTGIIDQFAADGRQLIANTPIVVPLDVETAATPTNAPINFTVQIVPGVNWAGTAVNAITVPTPTYTIYPAGGTAATAAHIPVTFNPIVMAGLPQGTYTAYILITPTPETPALGAPGSLQCGATIIGTSNATCVPVVFKVYAVQNANIPGAIVFGASTTPQQTGLTINNPINSTSTFNFTTFYVPTPVLGTALPAANVFYVGTGSTLTPAIGNTVAGSIAVGGSFTVPIQVNPVGLTTGVYSGQLLVSNTGLVTGATAQTSVPLIVYIGPKSGDDAPTGAGLGLTLPVNVPPVGTGALPGTVAGETPGAYALTLNVASGFGPTQVSDPTLVEVTGLSNTATTPYFVNAPVPLASNKTSVLPGVIVTNVLPASPTTPATGCGPTNAQLNSLGNSPLGPPCVWSVWVDATTLNSTNTVRTTACGVDPVSLLPQFGETGYLRFTQIPNGMLLNGVVVNGLPFATLDVPITVCVTDEPALILGMPQTFPNPTFGPIDSSSTDNFIAQPSNLAPGFALSIVEMQLAASSGSSFGPTVAPAISLFAQQFNSGLVCKTLDIHTNGGNLFGVTINPLGSGPGAFLTLGTAPSVFTGLLPAYANPFVVEALTPVSGGTLTPAPGSPFGPFNLSDEMQVFQICANTDNLGNAIGTFPQNFVISGGQVGPITVPVNFTIGPANGGPITTTPTAKFGEIGIFRQGLFVVDQNGNNSFDLPGDRIESFGQPGDIPVAGDWTGSGVVRIGVFRPANGHWYLDLNNNGKWDGTGAGLDLDIQFGNPSATCQTTSAALLETTCGDLPIVGDWTGTGTTKLGIFRGSALSATGPGQFYLDNQAPSVAGPHTSFTTYTFGQPGDLPVAANWLGTGSNDQIGVYRKGTWYVNATGDGVYHPTDPVYSFGSAGDIGVTGNWNGNAPKRIGVFTGGGQWYVDINNDHVFSTTFDAIWNYGETGDLPVVGGPYTLP